MGFRGEEGEDSKTCRNSSSSQSFRTNELEPFVEKQLLACLQMQQQSIAHRCVKAMLDEGSHIGNRSSGNNNHLTKLRRSVDSKASILNLQLRELSADDDPKGTPVAVFQQRRTHAQQQKRKYPKEIRHYLYPHLLYHPGFY